MRSRTKELIALLLAGCMTLSPSLGAAAAPETSMVFQDEETDFQTGREISKNPVATAENEDPKMRTVYLSDLDWATENHSAATDKPTEKDAAFEGGTLTLKVDGEKKTFEKGLGTQTDSTIEYDLEGKGYTEFEVYAGVDYSQREYIEAETCDVKFTVSIDGAQKVQTAVLNPESNAEHIVVDIPSDAKKLTLFADKVTNTWSDHADWADAKFTQTLPDPQNAAQGKPISIFKTADGTEAPHNPDSTVGSDKAVDGIINVNNYFDFGDPAHTGAVRQSIYAQLDLKGSYLLSDIHMWRYWENSRIYDATAIVVSNDEDFENATVIYNSDAENVHGLGVGTEQLYQETADGKVFAVPENTKARYIRVYTYGVKDGGVTNHIVELQVNAYVFGDEEDPDEPDDSKVFPNAETPLQLQGPGTNNQVTHPDVRVLDEEWNGYRYWMVYTPNKTGTSYYENPCIAASHDGMTWEFPATNPVQKRFDSDVQNESEHNCDTDIVYDPVNNRMIIYWEWAKDQGEPMSEIRYRISYDGVKWGVPDDNGEIQNGPRDYGVAIHTAGSRYSDLSPTVVYDEREKIYKMWANDAGNVGYGNNENNKVWYRTSTDGLTGWSDKAYVKGFLGKNEDGKQMYPWHQDVQWVEELQEYWALQQAFPQGTNPDTSSLRFSKSKDGINWESVSEKPLITVGGAGTWDAGQIYRSTFWYEPSTEYGQGTFHIWYAALAPRSAHWDIGYTSANYSEVMYKLTGTRPAPGVLPEKVELNKAAAELKVGESLLLTANVLPEDANNKTVFWRSDNTDVATVTDGTVTAVAAGTARITVKTSNNKTAVCTVTVKTSETPEILPSGVTLSQSSASLKTGEKITLTATVQPANADDKTVTWTSDNTGVATVKDGTVTAVAAGTAKITVKTSNNKTAVCTVTVKTSETPEILPSGVTLSQSSASLKTGEKITLTATVQPANADDKTVTWTSDNTGVATVKDGTVTAVAAGTAKITVKTSNDKTAVCTITVKAPETPEVLPSSVTLSQSGASLNVGGKVTLTATVWPANADDKTVTWTSDNTGVATVTDGTVTAVAAGTAKITVKTSNDKTAVCTVIVSKISLSKATVSGISAEKHTGREIRPSMTVSLGTTALKPNTDYTVSYQNNVNPGTAFVTITGKGNYSGSLTKDFTIIASKGKTYTVGKGKYKVTSASAAKGTVSFVKPLKKSYSSFSVPSKVRIGKYTYKVTEIQKSAFKSNKNLKKVTLGSYVKKINSYAFYNTGKLQKVTIKSKVLNTVGKSAFKKAYVKAKIDVPNSRLRSYKRLLKKKGLSEKAKII